MDLAVRFLVCPLQDIVIAALPQGGTGGVDGESLFGPTVRNSEAAFSLRLLRRAFVM